MSLLDRLVSLLTLVELADLQDAILRRKHGTSEGDQLLRECNEAIDRAEKAEAEVTRLTQQLQQRNDEADRLTARIEQLEAR